MLWIFFPDFQMQNISISIWIILFVNMKLAHLKQLCFSWLGYWFEYFFSNVLATKTFTKTLYAHVHIILLMESWKAFIRSIATVLANYDSNILIWCMTIYIWWLLYWKKLMHIRTKRHHRGSFWWLPQILFVISIKMVYSSFLLCYAMSIHFTHMFWWPQIWVIYDLMHH